MNPSGDFFAVIWPEDRSLLGEIRYFSGERVWQQWINLEEPGSAARVIADLPSPANYFFGVLPRVEKKGTAEACVSHTSVLWVDLDGKHFAADSQAGKAMALASLRQAPIDPHIIVDSGNGYHGYWLLSEPMEFEAQARPAMELMAERLGADKVYDRARVMRVPGTYNHKFDRQVPVRILKFDLSSPLARPADFEIKEPEPAKRLAMDPDTVFLAEGTRDWLQQLMKTDPGKGLRSEHAFKVMLWMIRYGWTDEEIANVFESFRQGVGAKYWEKKTKNPRDADRWLKATLKAARRAS